MEEGEKSSYFEPCSCRWSYSFPLVYIRVISRKGILMGLFDKIEELKQEEDEIEIVFRDTPETEGQKWFREEAERKRDELTNRKEQ